jgi:heat shock protein HtpX
MRSLKAMILMFFVNLLFVVVITTVLAIFHIQFSLSAFALFFGFGGAFFSLLISKWLVKRVYRMTQITAVDQGFHGKLYGEVQEMAQRAGIPMPELWEYADARPNAFATGPSRHNSMIAVSQGLLNLMDDQELRAVIAHEMGHIYNGDMLTTTLLMGLMNTFVIWFGNLAARYFGGNALTRFALTILFEMALSFLALIPITLFSRHREYAADAFAAQLQGKAPTVSALQKLGSYPIMVNVRKEAMATAFIHGSWKGIFATHPPIDKRIARVQSLPG